MTCRLIAVILAAALPFACGPRRIPPGTPPPEYEPPVVTPWPAGSAEPAGTEAPSDAAHEAMPEADAGGVDAAAAPASDAAATEQEL